MNVDVKSLIGRLNKTCYEAFNNAAGLCLSRTNYDIEIEHILAKLFCFGINSYVVHLNIFQEKNSHNIFTIYFSE